MRVTSVVGARPNFMKIAPLAAAFTRAGGFDHRIVHTGQHYDQAMSAVFFEELGIPRPNVDLGVGSGSHAVQTGQVMIAFEQDCLAHPPDLVLVVGDVNSTMAATLVAAKLGIPVGHVEAGLRSFDRAMPEEVNRLVTDRLSDLLLTTSRDADENLVREGVDRNRIHFVGNVMIDTLLQHREKANGLAVSERFSLEPGQYALMTLHRPSNVDNMAVLYGILDAVREIAESTPVIFPIHPRTSRRIREFELDGMVREGVHVCDPMGYLEFLNLTANAKFVLTDSGGLQEETTILGVPCLTLRENTERPVTITDGTNELVGPDQQKIIEAAGRISRGEWKELRVPELWDGNAAERIVGVLGEWGNSAE